MANEKKCDVCGTSVPSDADFCMRCGALLGNKTADSIQNGNCSNYLENQLKSAQIRFNKKTMIALFFIIVVVASITSYLYVNGYIFSSHDPLLRTYVDRFHQGELKTSSDLSQGSNIYKIEEWQVTWLDKNIVKIHETILTGLKDKPDLVTNDYATQRFNSIDAATAYVRSHTVGFTGSTNYTPNNDVSKQLLNKEVSVYSHFDQVTNTGYNRTVICIMQFDDVVQCRHHVSSNSADYSEFFNNAYGSNDKSKGWIVTKPFSKSINERGNTFYIGVIKNESSPTKYEVTVIAEIARSQIEAKQLYSQNVVKKANEGYHPEMDSVKGYNYTEIWFGRNPYGQFIQVGYYQNFIGWVFETQSG
jgi:predicted nucleic acid-binding Zn ribbon protein